MNGRLRWGAKRRAALKEREQNARQLHVRIEFNEMIVARYRETWLPESPGPYDIVMIDPPTISFAERAQQMLTNLVERCRGRR